MRIDKHNYEAYLLDYLEGRLSPAEVSEFLAFIKVHPELGIDGDSFEIITSTADNKIFPGKEWLKVTTTEVSLKDHLLIAKMEGDLYADEDQQLKQLLKQRPSLRYQQDLYEKTRLEADMTIVYPAKYSLKKSSGIVRLLYPLSIGAVAASVCLLAGYWYYSGDKHDKGNVAPKEMAVVKPLAKPLQQGSPSPKQEAPPLLVHHKTEFSRHKVKKEVIKEQIALLSTRHLQVLPVHETMEEPVFVVYNEKEAEVPNTIASKKGEYPDLRQLAKQYVEKKWNDPLLTDILESKKHHSIWDYAAVGINKLAQAAGADFKIERGGKAILANNP